MDHNDFSRSQISGVYIVKTKSIRDNRVLLPDGFVVMIYPHLLLKNIVDKPFYHDRRNWNTSNHLIE